MNEVPKTNDSTANLVGELTRKILAKMTAECDAEKTRKRARILEKIINEISEKPEWSREAVELLCQNFPDIREKIEALFSLLTEEKK